MYIQQGFAYWQSRPHAFLSGFMHMYVHTYTHRKTHAHPDMHIQKDIAYLAVPAAQVLERIHRFQRLPELHKMQVYNLVFTPCISRSWARHRVYVYMDMRVYEMYHTRSLSCACMRITYTCMYVTHECFSMTEMKNYTVITSIVLSRTHEQKETHTQVRRCSHAYLPT
jgi:hypothetical protein